MLANTSASTREFRAADAKTLPLLPFLKAGHGNGKSSRSIGRSRPTSELLAPTGRSPRGRSLRLVGDVGTSFKGNDLGHGLSCGQCCLCQLRIISDFTLHALTLDLRTSRISLSSVISPSSFSTELDANRVTKDLSLSSIRAGCSKADFAGRDPS
jgi:hypothetical protein